MAFFLLGTYPDGRLVLLSDETYEKRQDAMSALSTLSTDPGFEHWDAEMTVHDLEKGTSVLLVRPAVAAQPDPVAEEPVPVETEIEEPESDAPEPEAEATGPEAAEPEPTAEAEPERAEDEPELPEAPEDAPAEEPDEALAAVMSDLGVEDAADDESPLKQALKRTAEHMESQGIVPPESVGPAETAASDDEPAAAWPWDTAGEPVVDPSEAVPEGESAPETEPVAPAPEPEPEPEAELQTAPPAFELDPLEAPGDDAGSMIRGAGDDETMAASRPVILGAYDEPQPEPEPEPQTDATSDFILDLETIAANPPVPGAEAPAASEPAQDLSSQTCADCVYLDTCPNKYQLQPANCGSFQWK